MWRLLEMLNAREDLPLERYLRDEHLVADLQLHLARERRTLSSPEREIHAARSYLAS